jgi:hypothetical protein
MRVCSLVALILGLFIEPSAFALLPIDAGSSSIADDPCPGATAFMKRDEAASAAAQLHETTPTAPALANELKAMAARDQEARKTFFGGAGATNPTELNAIDAANLTQFKSIIARFGFPTRAMVGHEGVFNAWLLTQHADKDRAFQKQVLALIEAHGQADVRPGDVAMLADRIRVNEGKPQRYGSNFDLKIMQPTPIEDAEHVDERRARVHLMPMADYGCVIRHQYGAKQ